MTWAEKAAVSAARNTMSKTEDNLSGRNSKLKESQFLTSDNLALHKLGTAQVLQVLRASPTIHTYALKDGRTGELFLYHLRYRHYPASLLNSARFLQFVLDSNSWVKAQILYGMSVPNAFEVQLYFHALVLHSRQVGQKSLASRKMR